MLYTLLGCYLWMQLWTRYLQHQSELDCYMLLVLLQLEEHSEKQKPHFKPPFHRWPNWYEPTVFPYYFQFGAQSRSRYSTKLSKVTAAFTLTHLRSYQPYIPIQSIILQETAYCAAWGRDSKECPCPHIRVEIRIANIKAIIISEICRIIPLLFWSTQPWKK